MTATDLPQIDELMSDLTEYLHKLQAARDQLAQLNGEESNRFNCTGHNLPASVR